MAEGGSIQATPEEYIASGSEYVYDFYCELCKEDGLNEEAAGYCCNCVKYMCSSCINAHNKYRPNRHHDVLDQQSMPKDTPLSQDRTCKAISTNCQLHRNKAVEFYCPSHDKLVCSICFASAHRGCADYESIDEKSENIIDSHDYATFTKNLTTMSQKLHNMAVQSSKGVSAIEQSCLDAVNDIRSLKGDFVTMCNELERNLFTQLETMAVKGKTDMERFKREMAGFANAVDKLRSELEGLASSKRVCQLYVRMKESKKDATALAEKLKTVEESTSVETFRFEPNQDIANAIRTSGLGKIVLVHKKLNGEGTNNSNVESTHLPRVNVKRSSATEKGTSNPNILGVEPKLDIKNASVGPNPDKVIQHAVSGIGRINIIPNTVEANRTSDINDKHHADGKTDESETHIAKNDKNTTAIHVADINVKSASDKKRCFINGSVVLSKKTLVVVDSNNYIVKLIDTVSNLLETELNLRVQPFDVAVINKKQVAVSAWGDCKIFLIDVARSLRIEREITVVNNGRGVAFSQNKLLVAFYDSPRLFVINLLQNGGTKILVKNRNGTNLFEGPRHLCASNDGEHIYVSDNKAGRVLRVTFDGEVKSDYRGVRGPCKLCTDHSDNVYVAGYDERTVHMLTADCSKIKDILTPADGLDKPVTSVSHCRDTNRLYVDHNDNVYVAGNDERTVHMLTDDCSKIKDILTPADGLDKPVTSVSHCRDTNRLYVGMLGSSSVKVYQLQDSS